MRLPEFLASCYKAGAILPLLFLGVAFAHARPKVFLPMLGLKYSTLMLMQRVHVAIIVGLLHVLMSNMSLLTNALLFTRMPTL